ncbi:MAG: AAA family ATPase [Actinobacteria bacterium]|nr:AAA family ATPase [Actinomycetota bacterium]
MRPRELTLDGFRSYAGAATFSWEGRSLVGIVGPIGSGKSSILDGICFALYGRTPRLGTETKGLINQRRDEGKVALTFSVDGGVWRVVRALRRRGQAAHALYRVGDDGSEAEVTDKAREVTERVTELLGLDYDGFRRSVLLAQGQFAEFLEATPGERNSVLKGVFGFERLDAMRDAARRRRDEAAAGLTALERLRERADQDRKGLDAATLEQQETAGALARLEAARPPAEEAAAAVAALDAEAGALGAERQQMMDLAGRIPDREETEALLAAREEAMRRIAGAEEAAAAAAGQEKAASEALDGVVAATGGRQSLADAAAHLARLDAQREASAAAEQAASRAATAAEQAAAAAVAASEAVEEAGAGVQRAAAALAERTAAREAAEAALHEATHRDLAAGLRKGITAGDRCPVCEQEVAEVPAAADSGLDEAQAALRQAASAEQEAAAAERAAAQRLAAAEASAAASGGAAEKAAAEASAAAAAVEASHTAVAETAAVLAAALGEPSGDPAAVVGERRTALERAEEALEAARKASAEAAAAVEAARTGSKESAAGVSRLLARLADLAGRLRVEVSLEPEPPVLREALGTLREAWVDRMAAVDARLAEIGGARAERAAAREAALKEAGLGPDDDLAAAIAAAREQKAAVDGRVDDLGKRLEDLARLEQEHADLEARRARYQRLVDDLAPAKFPAFVLDDRRRALAALGSERFEYLSAGRYRFTDDGEFGIVDLAAADTTRSAASLSGGETFLASLALALALAEIVAREGGRLDAFFLDEGFGSLDDEHVALAMDGIERLVTEGPDRLIVIVSHVPGLRDRMEDLVVLAKDEVTGDTTVRAGAARPG